MTVAKSFNVSISVAYCGTLMATARLIKPLHIRSQDLNPGPLDDRALSQDGQTANWVGVVQIEGPHLVHEVGFFD